VVFLVLLDLCFDDHGSFVIFRSVSETLKSMTILKRRGGGLPRESPFMRKSGVRVEPILKLHASLKAARMENQQFLN